MVFNYTKDKNNIVTLTMDMAEKSANLIDEDYFIANGKDDGGIPCTGDSNGDGCYCCSGDLWVDEYIDSEHDRWIDGYDNDGNDTLDVFEGKIDNPE